MMKTAKLSAWTIVTLVILCTGFISSIIFRNYLTVHRPHIAEPQFGRTEAVQVNNLKIVFVTPVERNMLEIADFLSSPVFIFACAGIAATIERKRQK